MAACLLIAWSRWCGSRGAERGDGDRIAGVTPSQPKVFATLMQVIETLFWKGDSLDEGIPIHPQDVGSLTKRTRAALVSSMASK